MTKSRSTILAAIIVLAALAVMGAVAVTMAGGETEIVLAIFGATVPTITTLGALIRINDVKETTEDTNEKASEIHDATVPLDPKP